MNPCYHLLFFLAFLGNTIVFKTFSEVEMHIKLCKQRRGNTQSISVFVHGADHFFLLRTPWGSYFYYYFRTALAGPNPFCSSSWVRTEFPPCERLYLSRICTSERSLPKECAAVVLELKNRPSPRSPSFTTPVAVMNTFAGFISERKIKFINFKVTVRSINNRPKENFIHS